MRRPVPYRASWCNTRPAISPGQRWVSMFLPHTAGRIRQWRRRENSTFPSCRAATFQAMALLVLRTFREDEIRTRGTWSLPPLSGSLHCWCTWLCHRCWRLRPWFSLSSAEIPLLGIPFWLLAGARKLAQQCLRWTRCRQHSWGQ